MAKEAKINIPPESPKLDKPPKHARRGGTTKTKWPQALAVEAALKTYFDGLGLLVSMVDPVDGEIIADGADAVIKELIELGKVDRRFRQVLQHLASPGKYGPLVVAASPMVIGIAANHNLLPQFIFGKTKPEEKTHLQEVV